MFLLIIVSIIWSLSFGLIKTNLSNLDPNLIAFIRLSLALLVFTPFLKLKNILPSVRLKLILIGSVQYGLMYITYIHSYRYLPAYQIALFTILTPIYITLINDIFKRRFNPAVLGIAVLAVLASLILIYREVEFIKVLPGFILIQISNISFAFGQVAYKRLKVKKPKIKDHRIFSLLYLGAVITTLPFFIFKKHIFSITISTTQILVLLYLGIAASGICFFLWNLGINMTNIGNISVLNNLKIPLAIFFSVILFKENVNLLKLIFSFSLIGLALFLNYKRKVS
jgi:drug/metabolite transporter (DMT)-like permease